MYSRSCRTISSKNYIPNKEYLPHGYKHFGNDDKVIENISMWLKYNPFFTSTLTVKRNNGRINYHIISENPKDNEVSFFSRIIGVMESSYVRVNAVFDENLTLKSIETYKDHKLLEDVSTEQAGRYLLCLLVYYAQNIHAIIHIFHFVMILGIADSVEHSEHMKNWASPYFPQISLKFEEVKIVLLGEGKTLVGGTFKAERTTLLPILADIFKLWGNCKSANIWIEKFLFGGQLSTQEIEASGILEEYRKHAGLINGYATEVSSQFEKLNNGADLDETNNSLKLFFSNCGEGVSSVFDLVNWIEMISVTGLLHSGTLSYSRMISTYPVASCLTNSDTWTEVESGFAQGVYTTIIGLDYEKNVFSDQMFPKKALFLGLKEVVTKYAALSQTLKKIYFEKVINDPKFVEFGWIMSDYCPDGIDAKSFTLTTYI